MLGSGGWRYSDTINELGTLFFTLSGPTAYCIMCTNLGFPSISNCRRHLLLNAPITECVFRWKEVKEKLIKRNLPLKVTASEDGTVVTGRVQYDFKSNQIVGFVPALDSDGLPLVGSFPATSGQEILHHFKFGAVSRIAYVIMVRPLAVISAPICLALFGTDNKFDYRQVLQRWKWMSKEAEKEGIEVVGYASDGAPQLLKAMYMRTFIRQPTGRKWPWHCAPLDKSLPFYIQDPIHLLVKLKSKLLKPSIIIPMGENYVATRGHIIELIKNVSKDQHELTMSFIEVKDKMNFRAAQKLCAKKVSDLLRSSIHGSQSTAIYLDMMREITDAWMEPSLSPLERVKLLWKWLFFCRLWRKWIVKHPGYSISHNFITSNSYISMEINAHSMIHMIRRFRDNEEPELLVPTIMGSQDAEDFFRRARSMTTMSSTMTNFSILEFVHRIRRIDFISESTENLKGTVNFPKLQKLYEKSQNQPKVFILPEDYEIEQAVQEAYQSALEICIQFGMATNRDKCPTSHLSPVELNEDFVITEDPDSDDELIDGELASLDCDEEEGEDEPNC